MIYSHWKAKRKIYGLKQHVTELKGEIVDWLGEEDALKREAIDIKVEVVRVKAKCAGSRRELAKYATRKMLYVITVMLSQVMLTSMIILSEKRIYDYVMILKVMVVGRTS